MLEKEVNIKSDAIYGRPHKYGMVNLALHLQATESNLMHGIMCTLSFILVLQLHLAAWQHHNSWDYLMMVLQVYSDLCV